MTETLAESLDLTFGSLQPAQPRPAKPRQRTRIDLSKHRLLMDLPRKIAYCFFVFSIVLIIAYQISFLLGPRVSPMLEPDNLEYLLFSQLALHQGVFNPGITNPYLVYAHRGFFESAGLYQLPALLHLATPFVPLVWDFRILFGLAVIAIYAFTLLVTKSVLDFIPLNKAYRYTAYALVLMSFLLMQQTEVIEWRGNTFITAFGLIIFYLVCQLFLHRKWGPLKKLAIIVLALAFLAASYYMWSGWVINLVPFALVPIFLLYDRLKSLPKFYWLLSLAIFFIAVIACILTMQIQYLIVGVLSHFGGSLDCFYNPLSLSEVQCLNFSNGLYTVALDMFFLAITIKIFLSNRMFSLEKKKYEYFIIGAAAVILLELPLVLVYVRLLQVIAPYLSLGFAIGTVTLLSRMGGKRFVISLVVLAILISSTIAVLVFWDTTSILYAVSNPVGLQNAANWLAGQPNSTTFAFYGYGDYLELYGSQRVYADTIQELNISIIQGIDYFYANDNCTLPSLIVSPDFILTSNTLSTFTLFANSSGNSFAKNPLEIEKCGYPLAYSANGFYVWKA